MRFLATAVLTVVAFIGPYVRHARAMAESDFLYPSPQDESAPTPPNATDKARYAAKPWDAHQTTIGLNLGFASAVGTIGLTVSFSPTSYLESEIGIGQGFSGTQISLMQKIVLGSDESHVRFVSGAGISMGTGSDTFPDPSLWLNLDLAAMEIRTSKHFMFLLASGATIGLAGGKFSYDLYEDCGNPPACSFRNKVAGTAGPQGRVGIAFWF